ncbi:hypothetical protein E5D57_001689 [Metarhizium anisopliae]|nr:hypothetical protein E5D57_001689 [Metarhizium anisopliae]
MDSSTVRDMMRELLIEWNGRMVLIKSPEERLLEEKNELLLRAESNIRLGKPTDPNDLERMYENGRVAGLLASGCHDASEQLQLACLHDAATNWEQFLQDVYKTDVKIRNVIPNHLWSRDTSKRHLDDTVGKPPGQKPPKKLRGGRKSSSNEDVYAQPNRELVVPQTILQQAQWTREPSVFTIGEWQIENANGRVHQPPAIEAAFPYPTSPMEEEVAQALVSCSGGRRMAPSGCPTSFADPVAASVQGSCVEGNTVIGIDEGS